MEWDGDGAITAYEYDNLNRLVKVDYNHSCTWPNIVYPLTADVTYTYVGGSRLKETMVEASLGTTYYDYDSQDRLATYTPAGQTEIAYAYNGLNQKTSMTISGASPTSYDYFANGWLKGISGGGVPDLATYTYNPVGNRTQVDFDSGTATTYSYDSDPRYRISSIAHDPVYGNTLTIGYSRDNVGNPTSIGGVTHAYDGNSRLVTAGGTNYTYDWVGNRYPSANTYNAADELTASPTNTFDYLGTGSLNHQYSGQTTQKTYTYTAANLLDSITHNSVSGTPVSSMEWDADANRVSFTSSTGGTTQFVYDITAGIPAVIKEIGPGDPKTYVREPDGSLVAMFVGSYPYYYHFDALGSTRMLTDESGHITDSYSYDAWGNVLTHDPASVNQPYQYVGQLGYYTHYQDSNLPLLHLGVRFYDPGVGRFTQVDPDQNGLDWYAYAGDQPLNWVDPTGLRPWWCYTIQPWWWWLFPACQDRPSPPGSPNPPPLKPIKPPPGDSGKRLPRPEPLPPWTSVPPYMLPPGAGEMVPLLDPCAARDFICTKWIKDLERNYAKFCDERGYMQHPNDCEKLAEYIEDVKTWCQ